MKVCPTTADLQSHVAPDFFRLIQYVSVALLRSRVHGQLDLAACENEIQRLLCVIGAGLLRFLMESQDCKASEIEIDGVLHRRVLTSRRTFLSRFGEVQVTHHLYRPAGRNQPSISVLERRLGIIRKYFTPGAARLALRFVADCTLRDASGFCRDVGMAVSASSLHRLVKEVGARWEVQREANEARVRESESPAPRAQVVCASMDGVMAPLRRESQRESQEADSSRGTTASRYRELGCGTVATYDQDGERLSTIYHGRMPEVRKATLTSQLAAEMRHLQQQRPDLRRIYLCDGAEVNWRQVEKIEAELRARETPGGAGSPETMCIVDYYHACEHLKRAADAIWGEGTEAAKDWYQERKYWLRHFDGGAGQVWRSLKFYGGRAKGQRRQKIQEEVTYFGNQEKRMDYKLYERLQLPIGSGVIEAACKTLVTQRMKRSGMLWSHQGGQAILNLRAWVKSDRFDQAFAVLTAPCTPNIQRINTLTLSV